MSLGDEKYVLFTTFRQDGRAVSTPVWLAQMPDGGFAFTTGNESGKAKRLRHTPRVTLQGCDRSGVAESVAKRVGAKRFGSERVGVVISLNAR